MTLKRLLWAQQPHVRACEGVQGQRSGGGGMDSEVGSRRPAGRPWTRATAGTRGRRRRSPGLTSRPPRPYPDCIWAQALPQCTDKGTETRGLPPAEGQRHKWRSRGSSQRRAHTGSSYHLKLNQVNTQHFTNESVWGGLRCLSLWPLTPGWIFKLSHTFVLTIIGPFQQRRKQLRLCFGEEVIK